MSTCGSVVEVDSAACAAEERVAINAKVSDSVERFFMAVDDVDRRNIGAHYSLRSLVTRMSNGS